MLGANCVAFELISVRRQGGHLTAILCFLETPHNVTKGIAESTESIPNMLRSPTGNNISGMASLTPSIKYLELALAEPCYRYS